MGQAAPPRGGEVILPPWDNSTMGFLVVQSLQFLAVELIDSELQLYANACKVLRAFIRLVNVFRTRKPENRLWHWWRIQLDSSSPLTAVAGLTHRASEELQALDGIRPSGAPGTMTQSHWSKTGKLRACKTHLSKDKERALLGQKALGTRNPPEVVAKTTTSERARDSLRSCSSKVWANKTQ